MNLLKIAMLIGLGDWKRNLSNTLAICVATMVLLSFKGFTESMYDGLAENTIHSQLGHIQATRYSEPGEGEDQIIADAEVNAAREVILAAGNVVSVTERVEAVGLASFNSISTPVNIVGVAPDDDAEISSTVSITRGSSLFDFDVSGGLFGVQLLELLGADVGDTLTVLGTTVDNSINAVDITVVGAIDTGTTEINKRLVKANLGLVRDLLGTGGASTLVVMVSDKNDAQVMAREISDILQASPNLPRLKVSSWNELSEGYSQVVNLFDGIFSFIQVLVCFAIFTMLLTSFQLAVLSRSTELATMRSLGAAPLTCFSLIFLEGLAAIIVGTVLGTVLAIGIREALVVLQIPMPTPPGSSITYPIRIILEPLVILAVVSVSVVISLSAVCFPAMRAARVSPMLAMRV